MTPVYAHAGHWLVQLVYVAPVLLLVAAIGFDKVKKRLRGDKPPDDDA